MIDGGMVGKWVVVWDGAGIYAGIFRGQDANSVSLERAKFFGECVEYNRAVSVLADMATTGLEQFSSKEPENTFGPEILLSRVVIIAKCTEKAAHDIRIAKGGK